MREDEIQNQTKKSENSTSEKHDQMTKPCVTRPQMKHGEDKQNGEIKMSEEDRREMLEKHQE